MSWPVWRRLQTPQPSPINAHEMNAGIQQLLVQMRDMQQQMRDLQQQMGGVQQRMIHIEEKLGELQRQYETRFGLNLWEDTC